ncbi:MAG: hydrogenase nickel incorporation protein HypB [Planctomycetota bacterium]
MTPPPPSERIRLVTSVLEANDRIAARTREACTAAGVLLVDVLGGPGAGKTALLEATLPRLGARAAVIAGDLETSRDAERLAACGVPVVQITTNSFGGACHLDAGMVAQALDQVPLTAIDVLFVENVGNLVCPAEFDIGQHARVVVLSVAEGEDKPLKYPLAFRRADAAVVAKIDLLPHLEFDLARLRESLHAVHPSLPCFELSVRSGAGLEAWLLWIAAQRRHRPTP